MSYLFPDEISAAIDMLPELANQELVDAVDKLVDSGEWEWKLDPWVSNVVGVVNVTDGRAALVVYLADEDFEYDYEVIKV